MSIIEKHISLLGKLAKDRVTGFSGVVASISFDLYGCIQVVVTPKADESGKLGEGHWFDVSRVEVIDDVPVMHQPNFQSGSVAEGLKGPASKPAQSRI